MSKNNSGNITDLNLNLLNQVSVIKLQETRKLRIAWIHSPIQNYPWEIQWIPYNRGSPQKFPGLTRNPFTVWQTHISTTDIRFGFGKTEFAAFKTIVNVHIWQRSMTFCVSILWLQTNLIFWFIDNKSLNHLCCRLTVDRKKLIPSIFNFRYFKWLI